MIEQTSRDAAVIAASLTDPAAFAGVFDRHWAALHRFCVSRAGSAGEDIAAETFRVAFDQRARFDPARGGAGPWLYGIATNLLRRWFRSASRAKLAHGSDEHDFAEELFITNKTVKNHLSRIYEKIGVHSRAEAIALWLGVRDR